MRLSRVAWVWVLLLKSLLRQRFVLSAACMSLELVAAVPAATATVRAVLSVSLAAEILQTLRQAVVCIALANSVRGAVTVSDSMAVEDIPSGCDPPIAMVC